MADKLITGYLTESGNVVTPIARASFVYVMDAQQPNAKNGLKEPKYSIVLLFGSDADLTLLKQNAYEAIVAKWGADRAKWPANLKLPFRDQGEKQHEGYVAGCKMVVPTAKQKPQVTGPTNKPLTDQSQLYAGCYVRASVRAFTYETGGNKGVSFGLQNLQVLRDGERLGGGAPAEAEFEPVAAPAAAAGGTVGAGGAADLFG